MTRQELLELHKVICIQAVELMEKKNHDYSSTGVFDNFERCAALKICTAEQAFLVRLTDKLSRLITAVTGNELKVKDESFKDTVIDGINYLILLYAYVESKKLVPLDEKESILIANIKGEIETLTQNKYKGFHT